MLYQKLFDVSLRADSLRTVPRSTLSFSNGRKRHSSQPQMVRKFCLGSN